MKSFNAFNSIERVDEGYSDRSIKVMATKELGILYTYLKFGAGSKRIEKGEDVPLNADIRDRIGSELGNRARDGEEAAKRYLNNRMSNQMDKYGNKKMIKTSSPNKNLGARIMGLLKKVGTK